MYHQNSFLAHVSSNLKIWSTINFTLELLYLNISHGNFLNWYYSASVKFVKILYTMQIWKLHTRSFCMTKLLKIMKKRNINKKYTFWYPPAHGSKSKHYCFLIVLTMWWWWYFFFHMYVLNGIKILLPSCLGCGWMWEHYFDYIKPLVLLFNLV